MREPDTHVRFPSVSFGSQAEFVAYCAESRLELDSRYLHEQALALSPGDHVRPGTCAPCLRQARFAVSTEQGETLPSGLVVPNWREQLICDCPDRLNNRHRALLHFIESANFVMGWQRVLAFGHMSPGESRLCLRLGDVAFVPRLTSGGGAPGRMHRIDAPGASVHLAVSLDYLHHVPALPAALAEMRRVLVPGGFLAFTVPFRWDRAATHSHVDLSDPASLPAEGTREVHEIGWDILTMLRAAGFARCRVHVYWSEELGYLGPFNTLFSAET